MDLTQIGILISILGIILAIIAIIQNKRYKKNKLIRYGFSIREWIFSNPLFDNDEFDLKLNGKRVRDLYKLSLIIANRGNETLHQKDFIQPLRLEFDKKVNLFPFNFEREKKDIPINYKIIKNANNTIIEFNTQLIEPNDKIFLDLIYESNSHAKYKLTGRIVDGKIKYTRRPHEEDQEDYKNIIYNKYEYAPELITTIITVLLFLVFYGLYKFIVLFFPQFQTTIDNIKKIAIWSDVIFPILIITILIIIFIIVLKIFKKKIENEIKEHESLIKNREGSPS